METSKPVFVDTSAFKALVDPRDDFHKLAVERWNYMTENGIKSVTSNFILDESYTLIRTKCNLKVCQTFRTMLGDSTERIKVMRTSLGDELSAWDWFDADWSGLSFTDCTCFSMMRRLDLSTFFGFDKHFKRAGFKPFLA